MGITTKHERVSGARTTGKGTNSSEATCESTSSTTRKNVIHAKLMNSAYTGAGRTNWTNPERLSEASETETTDAV